VSVVSTVTTADKCREKATDCFLQAQIDPNDRLAWIDLAQCWIQLADHLGDLRQHSENAQRLTTAEYPEH
jgi:hypothetical protein